MNWQQYQHADENARMRRIQELLDAAAERPLTEPERIDLATEAGLGTIYRKQLKEAA